MTTDEKRPLALRATIYYLIFGLVWIVAGDTILAVHGDASAAQVIMAEYAKGIGYVVLTSIGLYLILRRLERHHHQERMRFRFISDNARDIVFRYRLRPTIGFDYISPSATEITGYTPHDHYANPNLWVSLTHPLDRHRFGRLDVDMERMNEPVIVRWRVRNGRELWVEQRASVLHDESGQPWAVDGIVRDITEQKHMEQALQQAVGKLNTLLSSSPLPIASLSSQLDVLSWNKAAAVRFGYSPEELENTRLPIFQGTDELQFLEEVLKVTESGATSNLTLSGTDHSGKTFPLDLALAPLQSNDDQVSGVLLIMRDSALAPAPPPKQQPASQG